MTMVQTRSMAVGLLTLIVWVSLAAGAVRAAEADFTAEDLAKRVTKAQETFKEFYNDPAMGWFQRNLYRAKGILIVPLLIKGGFIVGAYGGSGVLLAQDARGRWSYPAFYNLAALSVGLQAGASGGQVLLMIMTDKALERFLTNKFEIGADASIGAGPVGIGAKAEIFDIYSFSRFKGLFAGLTLDGGGVTVDEDSNEIYYGKKDLTPKDILLLRQVQNRQAVPLIEEVSKAARQSK